MEQYIAKNGKLLRCGYTTGSCAAAAAKAATELLLAGAAPSVVSIDTPAGIPLHLEVLVTRLEGTTASCAIRKDGGDDPDATHGLLVYASVTRCAAGILIDGGAGIGRVTKPGLDQPVSAAAINSTPRAMITHELSALCRKLGYDGGISVILSIPHGETIAKKTFNPRMGIVGGLSIVGTTGIVEPMSNKALVDTVNLELSQRAANGQRSLLLVPGNYGVRFAQEVLGLSQENLVMCSNFIGDAIDGAVEHGFERIFLIGHIGKLVKLALGITNTHSAAGDGRIEALLMAAVQAGADLSLLREISDCVSTDAALSVLLKHHLLSEVTELLGEKISACLSRRVPAGTQIGYVCFTNAPELPRILMQSPDAEALMNVWRK